MENERRLKDNCTTVLLLLCWCCVLAPISGERETLVNSYLSGIVFPGHFAVMSRIDSFAWWSLQQTSKTSSDFSYFHIKEKLGKYGYFVDDESFYFPNLVSCANAFESLSKSWWWSQWPIWKARSSSIPQRPFDLPRDFHSTFEAYYNTPKFMRKVKTHAFAYFHKRTRGPRCLSKQLHFAMYTIRKEMVYSKLLSFSIMRKLRNCVRVPSRCRTGTWT